MTFRDVINVRSAGDVPFHEHDASEISGEAVFTDLTVEHLLSGTIDSKEIIVAGGTDGIIKSSNYSAGSAGWAILGDGSAEFSDVTVRGTVVAGAGSSIGFDGVTAGTNDAALVVGTGSIKSGNYSAGSAGWIIEGDGDAEFNDVTVRGSVISGTAPDLVSIQGGILSATDGANTFTVDPTGFSGNDVRVTFTIDGVTGDGLIEADDTNGGTILIRAPGASNGMALTDGDIDVISATVNELNLRAGGTGIDVNNPLHIVAGSAAGPAYSFVSDTDTGVYLIAADVIGFAAGGSEAMRISGLTAVNPGADNTIRLGSSTARWTEVWAVDGTINTSDATVKTDVGPVPEGLFDQIQPYRYRRTDRDDKWHFGFVAQEVADVLPGDEYAVTRPPDADGELWGMRPDQLVPVLWAEVQALRARIHTLEVA